MKEQRSGASIGCGADAPQCSDRRIPTYVFEAEEADAFFKLTEVVALAFEHARAEHQLGIATLVTRHVQLVLPGISTAIKDALTTMPVHRLQGVPTGGNGDRLRATVLSLLRGGEIFQYVEQLDGQLTAPIEPKPDGAPNSNASPEPFGLHTDDAALAAQFRVEEIALLSVYNPAGTFTGFSKLEDVI